MSGIIHFYHISNDALLKIQNSIKELNNYSCFYTSLRKSSVCSEELRQNS